MMQDKYSTKSREMKVIVVATEMAHYAPPEVSFYELKKCALELLIQVEELRRDPKSKGILAC